VESFLYEDIPASSGWHQVFGQRGSVSFSGATKKFFPGQVFKDSVAVAQLVSLPRFSKA
jgi:hypothetical protein